MTGTIPGATVHARAIHLAGILAELGFTRLTLQRPGATRQAFASRTTDLPGLIAAAPDGSAIELSMARITIHRDQLQWESADPDFIRAANS